MRKCWSIRECQSTGSAPDLDLAHLLLPDLVVAVRDQILSHLKANVRLHLGKLYIPPLSRQMPTEHEPQLERRRQWSRHGAPPWGGCASGPLSSSAPPPAACSSSTLSQAPPSWSSSPPAAASGSCLGGRATCRQSWTGNQGLWLKKTTGGHLGVLPHWDGDLGGEPDRPLVVNIEKPLLSPRWPTSSLHSAHLWTKIQRQICNFTSSIFNTLCSPGPSTIFGFAYKHLVQSAWIQAHSAGLPPPSMKMTMTKISFFCWWRSLPAMLPCGKPGPSSTPLCPRHTSLETRWTSV